MADFFDPFDAPKGGESASFFDPFDAPAPAKETKKQNKGILADIGTDLKRGVEQLPGIATGLADIPIAAVTGEAYASKAANALGDITGFKPSQWAKNAEAEYSPGRQAAKQAVDQAWEKNKTPFADAASGNFEGLGQIAKSYVQNPQHLVGAVVESLPSMAVGGIAGRGAVAASKLAPVVGGAIGEGAVMAGQQMDQLTAAGADPRTAAAASAATGILGGAIGVAGGKVAQKIGVVDPETALAGGAIQATTGAAEQQTVAQSLRSAAGRVAGGAVSEGAFEELPQSVLEQALSNLAQGKPWDEGVARAAVEGTLAGAMMGGAFNVLPPKKVDAATEPPAPAAEGQQGPLLALPPPTYTGTPGDQLVGNDAERNNAIAKAQAEADALYASRDEFEREKRRGFPGGIPTITTDPEPIQHRIDALMGLNTERLSDKARADYEKALDNAFGEQIGFVVGKDGLEVPFTMGDYLQSQVATADITRDRPKAEAASAAAAERMAALAEEEATQQPDILPPAVRGIMPAIPVVGPLSRAANAAVQAGITPVQPVSAGILAPAPAAQPAASPLTAAATLAVTPAAATPSAAVPSVQTATAPLAEASNAALALTNTPARTEAPAQTPENPLTAAIEQPQTAGAVNLNLSEVRQKNGAIGTQGVSETGIRDVLTHVAGMQIPEGATLREMIEALKASPSAQSKLRNFTRQNPMQGYQLPDGTIQVQDGHHRAFLLDQIGDTTVPAVIRDYTGPSTAASEVTAADTATAESEAEARAEAAATNAINKLNADMEKVNEARDVIANEPLYRPLIEALIKNKRNAKQLGFDIDGAIQKAKDAMHGKKQMPGAFRNLANKAEKLGDTETASILRQIADLNDARKAPKKVEADQQPANKEAPATADPATEKAEAMSVEDRLRAFEKDAGGGFKTNDTAITIIKKAIEGFASEAKAEVTRFLKDNTSKQANGDVLLKPNFYDELAEVFIWTRDYLKNALDDYDATTYQSGARESSERADKTQAKNEADSAFDSESWDKAREERIKASKKSGAKHLDDVPAAVESMRGKEIFYVHDTKQRGVIRTVDNRGNVYVHWSDKYSADKELASEVVEDNKLWLRSSKKLPILRVERGGKTYSFESSLGPSDLKDYVFAEPAAAPSAGEPTKTAKQKPEPKEAQDKAGESSSKWSEGTNGFTGHKSYTFQPETGAHWATVQTSEQPNSYTISYRKGDQIIETEELGGAIGGMKFHVASRVRDFAAAEKAQHIENGKTETATPSVIAASVQKSAAKTEFNPKEALSWLLGKVDEAIAEAPTAKEKGVWDNVNQAVKLDGMMNLEEAIGFKVFDVPGDGRFKVLNLKERLQAFRDNVEKSPGFRKPITPRSQVTPAWQQTGRSGTESTIRELLEDGDLTAAYEFAKQIGKPMVFGDGRDGPIVYTDARPFELEGFDDFPMVSARTFTGNSDTWAVIHPDSGLAIVSGEKTRAKAEAETRKRVGALRPDSIDVMKQKMGATKGAQNTLAERWLAGAEEAEKKAQASAEQENRTARLTHSGLFNNPNWKRGEESAKPVAQKPEAPKAEAKEPVVDKTNESPEKIAESLDAAKIKAGYAHRAIGGLGSKVEMERKWFADALKKIRDYLSPFARNDQQKTELEYSLAKFADDYKERRYGVLEVGSSVVSSAVAGRNNFNSTQAGRRGSALDRAEADFNAWLEARPEAIKAELMRLRTNEERQADADSAEEKRIKKVVSAIASDLATAGAIDQGKMPGMERASFLAGAVRKIENLHKAGDTESLRRVFAQIRQYNDTNKKPLFSERHSVWKFEPEPVNAEVADEVQEESAPAIPEGYKKVTEYYRDGQLIDGYAPFAEGERVRLKSGGGNAGVVESFVGAGPAFPRAMVRFDNGSTIGVSWSEVEAEPKAETKQERHFRNVDALNPLTAPVEDGDWFRIGGQEWQARNGYTGRGWSLIDADKKTHPTINNIEANADLIREIVAADGAVEAAAEKELRTFSEGSTDGMKSPLAVTYILRDKSDSFFEKLRGFDSPQAKFDYLQKAKGDLQIPMEIGKSKRFGDQVDLNRALRDGKQFAHFSLAPRRGYVLATLTIDLNGDAAEATATRELNVGDAARLMNIDVVLAKKETADGVRYELFNAAAMKDGRAVLRRTDIDSGNVIGIRTYNDYDQAEKEVADAVRVADQAQEAQKREAWHTDLPAEGLPLVKDQGRLGGYERVPNVVAADAWDAITQVQRTNLLPLYAYYLPAANGRNGIARLFPDDQVPPAPWKLLNGEVVRQGGVTREHGISKLAMWLRSAPILASEEAAKPDSTERSAPTPPKTSYSGPADVSSRAGQMELANRAGTIAALKAMNGQLRELAPGKSLSDNEIENAGDLDVLRDQLSSALVEAGRKKKTRGAPKTETVGDMAQSFAKAGYTRGVLPMNRTEMRIGLNLDSPELDQRFEVVINRKGGEWRVSEVEVPELRSEGMVEAMQQFRADLAALNDGRWPEAKDDVDKAAEPATADSIGWDAMPIEQREAIAVRAGWSAGKDSHITAMGRRIAARAWAEHPDHTRGTLIRFAEVETQKEEASPAESKPASLIDQHAAAMDKLRDGTLSVEELKAAFALVRDNRAAIEEELSKRKKDELLRAGGMMFASQYKSDTKPEIVKGLYARMLDDFIMGSSISYALGGGTDWVNTKMKAIQARVDAATPEKLAEYAASIQKARDERKQASEQVKQAIADPKTLDDFRMYLRAKLSEGMTMQDARLSLTPEQRIQYDTLEAEASRKNRVERKEAAATDVRAAAKITDGQVIETKHTKTGEPLFVVKAGERVDREIYNEWNANAKRLGGWYSSFRGNGAVPGFQFKTRENADAFLQYLGGNTVAAKEVIAERRDAFADDRSQSAVERLTEMADRLDERADESLFYDRKTNTARRARFAASAEAAANADKALAQTMRNIAKAIADGTAKFLDRVRQKTQVEMLRSVIHSAKYDELKAKYPSYADQERHKGEPATAETADYAKWPTFSAYRSDLAKLARELMQIDGAKQLGQKLLKVADDVTAEYQKFAKENLYKVSTFKTQDGKPAVFPTADRAEAAIARSGFKGKATTISFKRGEHLVIMGPEMAREAGLWHGDDDKRITLTAEVGEEIVAKNKAFGKRNRLSMPYLFDNASADLARWKALGIETPAEMRSALREFIGLREIAKAPDKIKEMERAMIGRKNDGLDFFPTPAETAQAMIDAAELKDGMAVLEPSAGMGHIAEQIREAGFEPDVVEFNGDRRELLELKGFHIAGNDFMELSPRGFTYGDVFRRKDGSLGVMRGSGGMGSGRVGFHLLDTNGQPDARNFSWENRDELEGVEKRGSMSGYDRILMNPPFSNRRDAEHVRHAYSLLKPGGRIVAIMGEGVFFGQDKKAQDFRAWLEEVGGTSEKLEEGTFLDPSLPVNTATNARMVVIDKPVSATSDNEGVGSRADRKDAMSPSDKAIYGMAAEGKSTAEILNFIASASRNPFYRQLAKLLLKTGIAPKITVGDSKGWKMNAGEGHKYAAAYDPKADTVALFRPGAAERNMLHELVHAATIKALEKGGLSAAQMKALFAHVQKVGRAHGLFYDKATKRGIYGMSDIDEFVSEAFTNPKFQEALKKVAAPLNGGNKLSTAWHWFVRVVRGILGLKANDESALSAALEIGLGVMREDMQIRRGESGVPFSEITGREIERTLGRTLQEKATNWMRLNLQGKSFENDATGWDIAVGRKGINKAMSHGARDVHARSVAAIPDLLKHAILVASEENRDAIERESVPRVHHFYAPLRINGAEYIARMVVKEAKDGTRFYDYDTSDEISPAVPGATLPFSQRRGAAPSARLEMSMANLLSHVKAEHGGTDPRFKIRHNVAEFFRGMGIEAGASGKMIESIRSDVQFVAGRDEKTGFPTWKGAHVSLSSPRDVTESHDVFYRPMGGERAVKYDIRSANGQIVGHTVLEIDGDWPTMLLDIEVQKQHRGNRYAEKAVAGIVADAGEIGIWHIVPSARSWWERIGTQTVDAHNGTLAFNDYADARSGREDAQSLGKDVGIRYNIANEAHNESYDLPEERIGNRSLYGAELETLRRAAARLEDAERGVTFRVTEDGQAVVTGPARFNIPDRFKRFAEKHGLTFKAERGSARLRPDGTPERTRIGAMPENYRVSGALYAQEVGSNYDRTDRTRFNVADDGWSVSEPSKMDDVIYALQDKHIDTKRVVQAIIGAGKKIRDAFNPYLQEELFHGRAAKGVKDFLDFELRPLLKDMQSAGVEMGDFEEYLWNRHAEERNRQVAKVNPDMKDGGSGIKTADARAYLAGLPSETKAKYEQLAKRIDAISRSSQGILVSSGLETQETIDAWNGAYQHYVPLQREDVDSGHVGTGKGFSVRGSATKRAMGSGRKVVDIIGNLTMQRERNIVRAEKNRVSNALLGLAVQNPNPEFWQVDQAPKERVVEEKAIYTVKDAEGNETEFTRMADAEKFARSLPDADIEQTWGDRVTERVIPGFSTRDNVILTRINGQDHYIVFNERDERAMRMAQSLKNLDTDNLGRVLSTVGKATRYLASINTQYNPVFGVINLIRDAQGSLLNLSSTPLAGEQKRVLGYTVDALRGIYADIRAHRAGKVPSSNWAKLFEEFQREGGQTGYRDQYANAEDRAEAVRSELAQFKEGKAKQLVRGVFGWLSDYNETMENAVRLAAYKAATEKGMSKQQAASLAKNITVNFNRKGQMATQVGALYAFFNASVQGTARIAETLFDKNEGNIKAAKLSKTGKKIIAGGVMLGSMQALLLAAAGFDDDEPPEFVRERNLVMPIGDGKYLTLAMPLGFHVLPGIGRIATEFVLSGGKDPAKKAASFVSMFAEAFNPVGNSGFSLQTITPSVVDPFAALAENKDFTGKEIYRKDFNSLNPQPGHARAKDVSTVWSRYISEALNYITGGSEFRPGLVSVSPDALDYLVGQATGGVGREVSKAFQSSRAVTTGEDLPLYKVPLVGRFVGDTEGQSGQSQKFYDAVRTLNGHENEIKGLLKQGRREEATAYRAENPESSLIMAGNHAETIIRKLRAQKRELIAKEADKEQVRAIDERISTTMKRFNERYRAVAM